MVDFNAMLANAGQPEPIEPRELHALLNKKQGYGKLWDVQGQVLERWHERRSERDLVIKVNTGGGKTVDGLVILQSYVNEGKGPGLYVAPNNHLVRQVLAEAANLGIPVTTDVDGTQYLAGEAIGVINAHELVNGRSKFSNRRPTRPRSPIGAVVIDDAHAAIATTRTQLALSLQHSSSGYEQLLDLFASDLRDQSLNGYLDVVEKRRGVAMRVPFWAWREKLERVVPILRAEAQEDMPLYWSWQGVSEHLALCRAVFSDRELTITPHCPPIEHVTSFVEANHRIFLTATLADDSVLVTDFGADSASIARPITPTTAGDIGERMILAPQEINPSLKVEKVRDHIAKLSEEHNTVVIVPSEKGAQPWKEYAAEVAVGDDVETVVDRLRSGSHVGLVVLINRYDGIDLPNNACRVLVIDGLPEAFSPEERIRSLMMSAGSGVDDRQVQRIEQGMGRGVRSNEDHCVVFLLGPRLAQLTVDSRTVTRFSPATQAQLKLSRRLASQIDNVPVEQIISTARQALSREPGWVKLALQALRNIAPLPGHVSSAAIAERQAFELAQNRAFAEAVAVVSEAANLEEISDATAGILLELQATYVDMTDPVLGQHVLAQARAKNTSVVKPRAGVTYVPLHAHSAQAKSCAEMLAAKFSTPAALCLEAEKIIEDLVFDEMRIDQFEEAFREAGLFIGLGSQRPEHDTGSGPDNLWALGGNSFWVIEAKTGAKSAAIGKRDIGQLSTSMLWFGDRYDPDASSIPVMVHRAVQIYSDASPLPGMRVITEKTLSEFAGALRQFAQALSANDWTDPDVVGRLLEGHGLSAGSLQRYTVLQRGVKN
ncbi:helicase C-terminal domain-containing protein [Leucobacter salsicius]|uniref:helicase C-terminal domain-containing protein n=1 Tax=Leucobacter salsicius TaxID=664638 RepID=UPI00034C3300|nr:helicase C-terminal domain-containing protein [Leucobacter salsicius]